MRALKLEMNSISIIDVESNLQSLEEAVSGHFEAINLKDGGVMIANRQGMLKQYPRNDRASYISGKHIYGTALIVGYNGKSFDDVPEQYFVWLGN